MRDVITNGAGRHSRGFGQFGQRQRGPSAVIVVCHPPSSPRQSLGRAALSSYSVKYWLVYSRIFWPSYGRAAMSFYSVKYWHMQLSDCLSLLNNMTVSNTVAFRDRTPNTQKCWNELNDLLQIQGLSRNEASKRTGLSCKTNWPAPGRFSRSRPRTCCLACLDQG